MDTATKQRLDELMSWYVTGQIDEQDRAWVEQLIREDAQAHAQWQWHQRLQENLHAQVGCAARRGGPGSPDGPGARRPDKPVVAFSPRGNLGALRLAARPGHRHSVGPRPGGGYRRAV